MDIRNIERVRAFTTKDGSEIRELLAYRNSVITRQSLAEARLHPAPRPRRTGTSEPKRFTTFSQAAARCASGTPQLRSVQETPSRFHPAPTIKSEIPDRACSSSCAAALRRTRMTTPCLRRREAGGRRREREVRSERERESISESWWKRGTPFPRAPRRRSCVWCHKSGITLDRGGQLSDRIPAATPTTGQRDVIGVPAAREEVH